ncbi:chitin deacetylase 7-like [Ixodes scapularis]|uniref:chitin deacetylase 7-like n=1 Tax=Ixodes scapularis TaxID=6945 RepID=UPI001A9F7DE7|nr:chitin deacetylase 7-like [Ixodes scapularis]
MRLGIFLAVVSLGILHRASSVPHGVLPPSAYAVGLDTSLQLSKAPADECKNVSSPGSQKCGTKTVTHEKTEIIIEKTVETEIINGGKAQECKGCPDIGTTTNAPVTTPPTTPVPCTSTTPQTPTVRTTPSMSTTTAPPTSPTTPPPRKDPVTRKTLGKCNPVNCKLPNCMCESTTPPVDDMPQFVMLTFDDAVTKTNMEFYRELLDNPKRKNKASGCRIAATFFASGDYLDYPSVNELHRMGNEIALHSISVNRNPYDYWKSLDTEGWEREFVDQRLMVEKYANVPAQDIRGLRGPFLFTGGDVGFRMQHRHLDYDCTLIHKRNGPDDAPVFPYTLDYGFQKPCMVHQCPNDTYPGLWTVPLNYLFRKYEEEGADKYGHCSMADACQPELKTSSDTFEYLRFNFENFHNTNRAPFPVFLQEAWLQDEERKKGYLRFVDWLLQKEDVYLVTVSEVLDFMRYPEPRSSYAQRRCTKENLPEPTCPKQTPCHYPTTTLGGERYMRICGTTCPENYPWVNNPDGN